MSDDPRTSSVGRTVTTEPTAWTSTPEPSPMVVGTLGAGVGGSGLGGVHAASAPTVTSDANSNGFEMPMYGGTGVHARGYTGQRCVKNTSTAAMTSSADSRASQ